MADDNGTDAGNNSNAGGNEGAGSGGNEGNGSASTSDANKTFTQRELELIINDRLNRERSKFADYEALRDKASKWDEGEAARLSDIERANKAAQDAMARAEAAEGSLRQERLRNAILNASNRLGAVDPEAVHALINPHSLIDAKGEIQGVDEAVTALLESKPYLKSGAATSGANGKATGSIGQGGKADGTSAGQFTRTQLRDPAFFEANKAKILEAASKGLILDE